jgi:hypothetical protein
MLNARELVSWDSDRLWTIPNDICKLVFDDGVVETYGRAVIYSAHLWTFYKLYPEMQTRTRHHLGDRRVGTSTHIEILNTVFWDCYEDYIAKGIYLDREEMMRHVYQTVNSFYNIMTYRLEAHVRSIDMTDFIEVVHHDTIRKANSEVLPNSASIERSKKIIKSVLTDPRELIGNPIANNAKNGLTSLTQILHCVGQRGNLTEIDSNVFPNPITVGYVHGLRKLEDSLMESRSASKALAFSEIPLQTTEYFNRRLQLMAGTVARLHEMDCGSQQYLEWLVMPGDLEPLAGKYYHSNEGLKIVQKTDRHLIGEKIHIRSVLACQHPDPQGICSICYGDLALSIPKDSNIGHVASTMLCEQASQNVLSTKHQDDISNIETLLISEYDQKYIQLGSDPNTILLADRLEGFRIIITLPSKDLPRVNDVQYVDDVKMLQVSSISSISNIQITVQGKNSEELAIIPISIGSRMASMSYELLSYIKQHGLSTTASGHVQIDLKEWNTEYPLFVLPLRHLNMLEYMNVIAAFLRASASDSKGSRKIYKGPTLKDFTTADRALIEFNRIVSARLKVSVSNLEVLVYAAMVRSPLNLDYALPHLGNDIRFGSFSTLMSRRSLSAAMAFEHHKRVLYDPITYLIDNRMDHPLDKVLM